MIFNIDFSNVIPTAQATKRRNIEVVFYPN